MDDESDIKNLRKEPDRASLQPIACRLDALTPSEQKRRGELAASLRSAIRAIEDLPNGYEISLLVEKISQADLKELAAYERRCCAFMTVSVEQPIGSNAVLTITGGEGVKEFVRAALLE